MLNKIGSAGRILSSFTELVLIDKDRCVRLRHKWSKCDECMSSCPAGAIKVGRAGGAVNIDWDKCNGCGICSNVCKTGVYTLKNFNDKGFIDRCREIVMDYGSLEVRCGIVSDEATSNSVTVECIGIINPAHILGVIASSSGSRVHFRYDTCSNCTSKFGEAIVQRSINITENILTALRLDGKAVITTGNFPSGAAVRVNKCGGKKKEAEKKEVLSRRELFGYFKKKTQLSVAKTIDVFLEAEKKPTARRIDYSGKLPVKRILMLAYMKKMGEISKDMLDTSDNALITGLEIDENKCDICGICYKFCPAGALTEYSISGESRAVKAGINFKPAYCVKCGLCVAACFRKAIKYADTVSMACFIGGHDLLLIRATPQK